MAVDQHLAAAIAQTVAYVPIVPPSIYILVRNFSHPPRIAWTPFVLFSLMRLAGGPVVIALEKRGGPYIDDNFGLIIAAEALLNIGLIPMIVATLGQVQLILEDSPRRPRFLNAAPKIAKIGFIIAAVGLVSASGLQSDPSNLNTGRALTQASKIIFAVVLAGLVVTEGLLWQDVSTLTPYSRMALKYASCAVPFVVRTVYALLNTFTGSSTSSAWNPVYGSAVLFSLMCLLPEYVSLCLYMWVGLKLPRHEQTPEVAQSSNKDGGREENTRTTLLP
ncbi:hypothetical protein GQ53DRAFT_841596 [Thozetella sp. PMI_491]|nr:hypothetical protein GQ53DRAFT_841596 [Thozetella sp. PMI_491]